MMISVSAISGFSFYLNGLLGLDALDLAVESVEAIARDLAVAVDPIVSRLQRLDDQLRWTPLRCSAPTDQPCPLEHLQVLGYRLHAHREGLGQLVDRRLAVGQAGEDRPSRGVGQGGEGRAELVVCGAIADALSSSTVRLLNRLVDYDRQNALVKR
jgi:hypothetical protein